MVRTLKDPRSGEILYVRKYRNSNRYYLSRTKRADELEGELPEFDYFEEPVIFIDGRIEWRKTK